MSVHCPSSTFYSISGLQKDRFILEKNGRVRHSVVLTEEDTGVLRVALIDIRKNFDDPTKLSIKGHYLLHAGPRFNQEEIFLDTLLEENDGLMMIHKASFLGQNIDLSTQDRQFGLLSALNRLIENIGRKHEWSNLVRIFEDHGLAPSFIGRKSLPGLYPNGEVKSFLAERKQEIHQKNDFQEPSYPAPFFSIIAGFEEEQQAGREDITHSFTVRDEANKKLYSWSYHFKSGKKPGHIEMSCNLAIHSKEGEQSYPLYRLTATPQKTDETRIAIRQLEVYHPNSGGTLQKVNLANDRAVSDSLKLIRMYNRTIRSGMEGLEEDFRHSPERRRLYLPTDIMMLTGLTETMMPAMPTHSKGHFVFTPLGGQNNRITYSAFDQHIGGNSYRFDYYPPGNPNSESLIIDAGALFHDKYDLTMSNIGRYLHHKHDKTHVPKAHTRMILFTHPHKDHLAQLGYIIKKGYRLPPMIMPPLVLRQIKRDLAELKMDKKVQAEIWKKCVVIEPNSIPANAVEGTPHKVKIGKDTLSLYWEFLKGDRLGQYERYPVVEITDYKIRIGPMPHSNPGFMYEIITPAGAHLHTGDFKLDPTLQLYQSPYQPWLDSVTSKAVSIDSTGTTREPEATTPTELQIQRSLARLFNAHPEKRFICPVLGSNVARLTTLISTMGQVGKGYLVVDGKALQDLVDDLESIHGLYEWAERVHGVTIAKQGSKEVRRIYEEEPAGNYVIAATGTQDEPYSSMNRALRDWLPEHRFRIEPADIVVPLQGPIPVGKNQNLRKSARYFAEVFHGIPYILPEEIEKESDYLLSGSGHASPLDIKNFYAMIPSCKVSYPVHGGPKQLEAGARIAEQCGLTAVIASNFEAYQTRKDGIGQIFRREVGDIVGIRNRPPTPEQFFLKRNFTTTVVPLKPRDNSNSGIALSDFEQAISSALGRDVYNETSQNMSFALSRTFNMSAGNGYLVGNYAFGIDRYEGNIYKVKHIGAYAALDTEATGTDPNLDHIEQFSLAAWSLDRKLLMEEELVQKIPDYITFHPEALLVTNRNPEEDKDGEHPLLFSEKISRCHKKVRKLSANSFKSAFPEEYAADKNARIKTINIAHNFKFDDRFLQEIHARNLSERVRPHSTDGNIAVDTRNVARAIHAIYPEKFKVRKKEDGKFFDFTLKALCEENSIEYDDNLAHNSALYDSHCAMHLFWKQEDIAPDIVAQMIFNADSSTGHLLNDMLGMDTGFNGPYPVFSYVSSRADRPDIRLGSFVGTVGRGRYAVVLNMEGPIKTTLSMKPKDILDKIKNLKDDTIELIDLRYNPIILPARFFYIRNSVQKFPKEMIDRRAHELKEHLNYVSPASGWKNISEKIEALWQEDQSSFFHREINPDIPDLKSPVSDILRDKTKTISRMAFSNLSTRSHSTFNPISQKTLQKIRSYRNAVVSFLEMREDDISAAYKTAISSPGLTEEQSLLVNNIHFDLRPKDLSPSAIKSVENARAFYAAQTSTRAAQAVHILENNPERLAIFIKEDETKKSLFEKIRHYVAKKSALYKYDERARSFVHPWRDSKDPKPTVAL